MQRHRQHWVHRKQSQSIINNTETQTTLGTQETVAINNRQSETQTTLGTQETVTINNRQSETQTPMGTQETVTINNRQYRDTDNIGHTGNSDNQ